MTKWIRWVGLIAILTSPALTGCGPGSESKPNPDLKVPDVPPGGHGSKDKGMTDPKKK